MVQVDEAGPPAHTRVLHGLDPRRGGDVPEQELTLVPVEGAVVRREVRAVGVEPAVVVVVGQVHAHAGLLGPHSVEREPAHEALVGEAPVPLVHVQLVGGRVVGHVEVQIPVVVDVAPHHAEPEVPPVEDAGLRGDVGEGPVGPLAVEGVGGAPEPDRAASAGDPAVPAPLALRGQVLRPRVEVVCDVQVEAPVGVVVPEGRRRAPARVSEAGLRGHVRERPVAVVAVEGVGPEVGQVQVDEAVVVHVGGAHPHAPGAPGQARSLRHVLEGPVPPVAEEHPVGVLPLPGPLQSGPLRDVEVHPPVVVVVEGPDPPTLGLEQIALVVHRPRDVAKRDAGRGGHVHKRGDDDRGSILGRPRRDREEDQCADHGRGRCSCHPGRCYRVAPGKESRWPSVPFTPLRLRASGAPLRVLRPDQPRRPDRAADIGIHQSVARSGCSLRALSIPRKPNTGANEPLTPRRRRK